LWCGHGSGFGRWRFPGVLAQAIASYA
jgi:hypothetical protein